MVLAVLLSGSGAARAADPAALVLAVRNGASESELAGLARGETWDVDLDDLKALREAGVPQDVLFVVWDRRTAAVPDSEVQLRVDRVGVDVDSRLPEPASGVVGFEAQPGPIARALPQLHLGDRFALTLVQARRAGRDRLARRTARARDIGAGVTIGVSTLWIAGQIGMIDSDGGVDLSSLSNLMVYNLFVTPVALTAVGAGTVGWSVGARRHRMVEERQARMPAEDAE